MFKKISIALLVAWLLALSWCVVHIALTYRNDEPDDGEIDFFYDPQAQEPRDV